MSDFDHDIDEQHGRQDGPSRRRLLECMTWAGTGVLWTISGGVPHSLGLVGQAMAQDAGGLSFLQISDSHIGFDKPVNPNARGTLEEAIARIQAMPVKPSFMLHTGDITHLSKVTEFDDAEHIISQAGLDVHYVPGEHDILDPEVTLYRDRHGRGTEGAGWYSFDASGVHFMGLVNVAIGGRFSGLVHIDNPGVLVIEHQHPAPNPNVGPNWPPGSPAATAFAGQSSRSTIGQLMIMPRSPNRLPPGPVRIPSCT